MRLLLNLITALSAEEAEKLSALRLEGKQLSVMELAYKHQSSDAVEATPEEMNSLQVTSTHFYEISSILLGKCYKLLVPEGGVALLEFLANKNLAVQFKQELRKQRKHLHLKKGREAEQFYLTGFELLHRFTLSLIDFEMIDEYRKLYLAAKKDINIEDELAVKARDMHLKQLGVLADTKDFAKERSEILVELTELERVAKRTSHPYFCYNTYSALAWYWRHLGVEPERSLEYLKLALPYAIKLEGYIFRDAALEMKLRLADAYFFLGATQEALEIFEKTYAGIKRDHQLWKRTYFIFRYLDVLIFNGKYAKAEKILQEHLEPLLKLKPTTASATAASQFTILYLLMGNYEKAKEYLDIAMSLNQRTNFTLYNEVHNRYLEAAYFYLIGEWNHTLNITDRGLQYLRGKNLGLHKHIFGYNFMIIKASIAFYTQGEPIWHKFEAKYAQLTLPAEGLFGLLLKKIRTTNAAKKKKKK